MSQGPIPVLDGALNPANNTVALRVDAFGNLRATLASSKASGQAHYQVAASQTNQQMGATGAIGDVFSIIMIIPTSTSPGAVSISDGATSITVFAGGAASLVDLRPFLFALNTVASGAGWKVTTGANVSAVVVGTFT
jgi:hypothetical protein